MVKQESTSRREALYEKVIKQNLTIDELKQLTRQEFNTHLGTSIKRSKNDANYKAQLRLLDQISNNLDDIDTEFLTKNNITNTTRISGIKKASQEIFKPDYSLPEKKAKPIIPKEKGSYEIAKVKDLDTDKEYWLKYKNINDFYNQLDDISDKETKEKYEKPSKFEKVLVIFYGSKKYVPYTYNKFKKLVKATP